MKKPRHIDSTRKPKDVYRKIMNTKLCDVEHRKVLFEYLKMSMKQHYPTIFGEIDDIGFALGEDGTVLMRIYQDSTEEDAPYEYELWKVLTHIPIGQDSEWCFETFIDEMN